MLADRAMNPILLRLLPYLALFIGAAAMGGVSAWKIQGVRIDAAKNELAAFKLSSEKAAQDAKDESDKITKETNDAIPKYVAALHDYYRRNPVIRLLPPVAGSDGAVPAASGESGHGPADDVPAAEAWHRAESALEACGVTTLMFVACRDWAKEQRTKSIEKTGGD